ncbi:MAG: hypothetical protein L0Z53_24100 [Acidobacteriales bacterium]|nr:hypothetical protein [Terriglobales bacterium]
MRRFLFPSGSLTVIFFLLVATTAAQERLDPVNLYQQLRAFQLGGESITLENVLLKRDRMEFTFDGQLFPAQKIGGRVFGGVFIGRGQVKVQPWNDFERGSVQRFLKKSEVQADFKQAILRFDDDTYEQLTKSAGSARQPVEEAQRLAGGVDARIARETGMNVSSVLTSAVSSGQDAGFFFGEFDGGDVGRFCALLDNYMRSLGTFFTINGGEKGMLFQYRGPTRGIDIWTAFYSQQDFQSGRVSYADVFDLVDIAEYRMDINLREAGHWLRMTSEIDLVSLQNGVQAIPLSINEGLPDTDSIRLKKGVKVLEAALMDGTPLRVLQEPWEAAFTIVLPRPLGRDEKTTIKLRLEGENTLQTWEGGFHYPMSTTSWYPRHSYLRRSKFNIVFHHKEKTKVISVGERIREESAEGHVITEWRSGAPITFAAFAVGPFERHNESVTVTGGRSIPLEFYSAPSGYAVIKEDFMLAEMMNTVNFFSALFGEYPYQRLGAVYFPGPFGQGLPTLLLLPSSGRDSLWEFAFIAHETSHQWWGDMIAWRSYRDQWLSEGFANYSGALYAATRKKPKEAMEILKRMRESLESPPRTEVGIGAGKLYQIGPLVLGHRLGSNRSLNAYGLIYDKGALVLRMLHFLLSDPGTGNDDAFYNMMKDFVKSHRDGWASTESFLAIASQHFANTPIAKKYSLKNLDWFVRQWVYDTGMPRYRLEYRLEPGASGSTVLSGTVFQEQVPDNWFMPLPLVLEYGGGNVAQGTIHALGPRADFKIPLPAKPQRVRLDPYRWVLSEKTSEEGK